MSRFMQLAHFVASWSKDPRTKVGAVITYPDGRLASIGYNGFPRGTSDDPALYADRPTKLARIVHAELNAILTAPSLHGQNATLWTTKFPCSQCMAAIIQAGIQTVVTDDPDQHYSDLALEANLTIIRL